MGCRFEGVFLEGHVIVWCTGMHLNTQCRRFFILGTLRLLDHVSLSLSFTRSYYKTKTATSIVNQKEVIRIRADTSMISLKSNFKVTRSIESIHSAFGFTGQGRSGGASGSCPGSALGPEVSEVPFRSDMRGRFQSIFMHVPNMFQICIFFDIN